VKPEDFPIGAQVIFNYLARNKFGIVKGHDGRRIRVQEEGGPLWCLLPKEHDVRLAPLSKIFAEASHIQVDDVVVQRSKMTEATEPALDKLKVELDLRGEMSELHGKLNNMHRRAQKAESRALRAERKYEKLREVVRGCKLVNLATLRPLIEALTSALAARGVRSMYGVYSGNEHADENNVIMQIVDSLRTLNASVYYSWRGLLSYAPDTKLEAWKKKKKLKMPAQATFHGAVTGKTTK
jgi:hypothetical protein